MKVAKWGNSLALRLPAQVVELLQLKADDEIEVYVEGTRALGVRKVPGTPELLTRLHKMRGRLPSDFKFERLEAHER